MSQSIKSGIVINPCQRGNPVIHHIQNVSWEFGDTVSDYEIGNKVGILYLSLKYHKMHSNYIYDRLKGLKRGYQLRILLLHIDGKDFNKALRELTRVSVVLDYSLVLAWSFEEAGKYIETFKMFQYKSADSIKERIPNNFMDKITSCLTEINSISKTNVLTLAINFESLSNIINSSESELSLCPGFGEKKIENFLKAMDEPFLAEN